MRRTVLVLLLAGGLSGCGYALVGKGITTDASIKKIAVPLFRDATAKPGLDRKITDKVIEELLKRGRFEVVQDPAGADAVVEGELLRHDLNALGVTGTGGVGGASTQASRYAVTVVAKVRYIKTGATEPIWQNERFSFTDEYEVGTDPGSFFDQEGPAMDRLATAFARGLVAAMLEAF
jgi:lipopolysaccharide assembly LptE-like protein